VNDISFVNNLVDQVTMVLTANKFAFRALNCQGICQREASHDVTSANLYGCVSAKNDMHV
jgi:hypothetical protein